MIYVEFYCMENDCGNVAQGYRKLLNGSETWNSVALYRVCPSFHDYLFALAVKLIEYIKLSRRSRYPWWTELYLDD